MSGDLLDADTAQGTADRIRADPRLRLDLAMTTPGERRRGAAHTVLIELSRASADYARGICHAALSTHAHMRSSLAHSVRQTECMSSPWPLGSNPDAGDLRSCVSRLMVAEDARWTADVVQSTTSLPDVSAYVSLVMGHHFVRIAYEGAVAVRSTNPDVGVPALAALLEDKYAAITARARHATKLLDNTKKSYADVLLDLAKEMKTHHEALTGNSVWWARRWETDLGIYSLNGTMIGATAPISYRLGFNPTETESISGADLSAVTNEWGGTVAVLSAAALDASEPAPTLTFSGVRFTSRDVLVSRYLPSRFDPRFAPEVKLLMLLVEGDLNTARLLLPHTSAGHEHAVFRARVVTAYHCLSALRQICDTTKGLGSLSLRALRSLLSDAPTQRLLSAGGAKVRNRSVHYEMSDPATVPDLARPMYGLVEAVYPRQTFEGFDADIRATTERAAEVLAEWTA